MDTAFKTGALESGREVEVYKPGDAPKQAWAVFTRYVQNRADVCRLTLMKRRTAQLLARSMCQIMGAQCEGPLSEPGDLLDTHP